MGYQILFVCSTLIAASLAGYNDGPIEYQEPQAIATQQANVLRSPGNLGQVSAYSKALSTPYSNVQKADIRVSNDALAYPAPARAQAYATAPEPAYASAPAQSYSAAPEQSYSAAPAQGYSSAPVQSYSAPARAYAPAPAPAPPPAEAAPIPPRQNLLGIAYSAAPEVARITYKNGYGTTYTY